MTMVDHVCANIITYAPSYQVHFREKKSYLLKKFLELVLAEGDELKCTLHYLCIKGYLIAP